MIHVESMRIKHDLLIKCSERLLENCYATRWVYFGIWHQCVHLPQSNLFYTIWWCNSKKLYHGIQINFLCISSHNKAIPK